VEADKPTSQVISPPSPSILTDKISILLPTRKRPQFMKRLYESIITTVDDTSAIEICFCIDNDDTDSLEYIVDLATDPRVKYTISKRDVLSKLWNNAYDISSGEILMHCGDDIVFRTPGWDTIVRSKFNEFPDKIVLLWGNDLVVPVEKNFGTHCFLHRKWVEATGYFVPPYFVSDYNDTWFNDVADMLNRKFHINIVTEHMHYTVGKHVIDENTQERLNRHIKEDPKALYESMSGLRREDASKLCSVIESYKS